MTLTDNQLGTFGNSGTWAALHLVCILNISLGVALIALEQSYGGPCASEKTLMDMGKMICIEPKQSKTMLEECPYFLRSIVHS